MPSTYTSNLGVEKPATGEQAGVWGQTANKSYDFLDMGIDGGIAVTLSTAGSLLETVPGTPSDARSKVVTYTGETPSDVTVTIKPNNAKKIYFVRNQTTGTPSPHAIIFTQGTGASFRLEPGRSAMIFADGGGGAATVIGVLNDFQASSLLVTGALTVNGAISFTGATTFANAATFQSSVVMNAGLTLSGGFNVAFGGDQPYDLYYRGPGGGNMARLGIGGAGTVLQSTGSGYQWVTVSFGIGSAVASSAAWSVLFANNSGQLSQDANFKFQPGVGLAIGRAAPNVLLHLGQSGIDPSVWLDGAAKSNRRLGWMTNTAFRWFLQVSTEDEDASNVSSVGANLYFGCYNNTNTVLIAYPLSMFRATGNVTIGTYGDYGAQLAVVNRSPASPAMQIRAASGQTGNLQEWYNGAGALVAYFDKDGKLTSSGAPTTTYIPYTNNRLDMWGTIAGHPYADVHIGNGGPAFGGLPSGSLFMESMVGSPVGSVPDGNVRIYYRGHSLVIQSVTDAGPVHYAVLHFTGAAGPANWNFQSTAP